MNAYQMTPAMRWTSQLLSVFAEKKWQIDWDTYLSDDFLEVSHRVALWFDDFRYKWYNHIDNALDSLVKSNRSDL